MLFLLSCTVLSLNVCSFRFKWINLLYDDLIPRGQEGCKSIMLFLKPPSKEHPKYIRLKRKSLTCLWNSHILAREIRRVCVSCQQSSTLQIIPQTTQSTTELVRIKVYKISPNLLVSYSTLFGIEGTEILITC